MLLRSTLRVPPQRVCGILSRLSYTTPISHIHTTSLVPYTPSSTVLSTPSTMTLSPPPSSTLSSSPPPLSSPTSPSYHHTDIVVDPSGRIAQSQLPSGLYTAPSDPDVEAKYGYHSVDSVFDEQVDYAQNNENGDNTNRAFTYFVQGSAAAIYASVGRSWVHAALGHLSASADVLALSALEVDISGVLPGTATTVKWRGKPVFIRNRTQKEIDAAKADDTAVLRDPQTDAERFSRGPEKWAILIGVCTHLGCVPMNAAGDYNGWFCPCHGSHYDTSGRIRKGPAPLNLAVPPYRFLNDTTIVLG